MGERRMYAKKIIHSDKFMNLSDKAKLLFYELNIEADDDGFISNSTIPRMISRASEDDLKELIAAGFFYEFPSGVLVELCWLVGNKIRNDRRRKTDYQSEFKQLFVDDNLLYKLRKPDNKPKSISNNKYNNDIGIPDDNQMTTNGIPDDNQTDTNGCSKGREVKGIKGKLGEVKPSQYKTRKESTERKPTSVVSDIGIEDYEKLDQMTDEGIKSLLLKNGNNVQDFFDWLQESTGLDQKRFSKDFQDRALNCFRDNTLAMRKQKKEA